MCLSLVRRPGIPRSGLLTLRVNPRPAPPRPVLPRPITPRPITPRPASAPYEFTPPSSLQPAGQVLNGSLGASPSWLTFSREHPIFYSTDESSPGRVFAVRASDSASSFSILGDDEQRSNGSSTAGSGPVASCVVGPLLFLANYNSGSAAVHQLTSSGSIDALQPQAHFQFEREPRNSTGPVASRQDQSYAHQVAAEPLGRWVYVPDLGADRVHRLAVPRGAEASAKDVTLAGETVVPAGSGPRHIAFYAGGKAAPHARKAATVHAYLASELSTTLTAFSVSPADGSLSPIGTPQLALPAGVDPGGNATAGHVRTTSEVAVSPDGKYVYVGTRHDDEEDHVAVFERDGESGAVRFLEWVGTKGRNLRHFSLSPDPEARYLAAANQDTGSVYILERDPETGSLKQTGANVQNVGQVAFAGFVTGPSAKK